jgi:hypothetical protein
MRTLIDLKIGSFGALIENCEDDRIEIANPRSRKRKLTAKNIH